MFSSLRCGYLAVAPRSIQQIRSLVDKTKDNSNQDEAAESKWTPFSQTFDDNINIKKMPKELNPDNSQNPNWSPYEQIFDKDKYKDWGNDPLDFKRQEDDPPKIRAKVNTFDKFKEFLALNKNVGVRTEKKVQAIIRNRKLKDQKYDYSRVKQMGEDLYAAQFVTCYGGAVKFTNQDCFIRTKAALSLPEHTDHTYKVEAIDCANVDILYEGLQHFTGLKYLRWISFKDNKEFDNWCVDRLSLLCPTLEFINLSGCTKVDHNAFSCFYRFKRLKGIAVENMNQTDLFKLACLTLEKEFPDIQVIGLVLQKPPKSAFSN